MTLYAIGNGFLAIAAFAYYLQYAKGNLRYHLIGNAFLVIILIPGIVFAATYYGAVGAGYVWLMTNGIYLFSWVAFIHHKLEPGLFLKWLGRDCLCVVFPGLIFALCFSLIDLKIENRLEGVADFVFY